MQFMHLSSPINFDRKLHDFRMPPYDVLDRSRKHIDAPDCDHVIPTAQHTTHEPRPAPAARARLMRKNSEISGSITDERHSNTTEIGKHKFSLLPICNRHQCGRINDLRNELVFVDV